MGSQTFTTNLCSQYICLCFLAIRFGYLFLDSKNIRTLLCVCVMLFCDFAYIKCYLLQLLKTVTTLQHYCVRYVLSSLCFGTALGEVFDGLDGTVDVGTLTVLGIPHSFFFLCGIPNTVKVSTSTVQSKPPNMVNTSPRAVPKHKNDSTYLTR